MSVGPVAVPSPQEELPAEQWAICTCTACGNSGQCTPWSDYYTIPQDPAALLCEGCFAKHIGMPMARVHLEES